MPSLLESVRIGTITQRPLKSLCRHHRCWLVIPDAGAGTGRQDVKNEERLTTTKHVVPLRQDTQTSKDTISGIWSITFSNLMMNDDEDCAGCPVSARPHGRYHPDSLSLPPKQCFTTIMRFPACELLWAVVLVVLTIRQ
jgi:hypothetical protein